MARPRGRTKTARISVNLSPQEYACLVAMASQEEVPVGWIARRAIADLISKRGMDAPSQMGLPLSRQRFNKD